jgi:hypothetical protein
MSDTPISLPDTIEEDADLQKYISAMETYLLKTRAIYDRSLSELRVVCKDILDRVERISEPPKVDRPAKRGYYRCGECGDLRYKSKPHVCGESPNSLLEVDLDEIHKDEGWEVIGILEPDTPDDPTPWRNLPAQTEPLRADPEQLNLAQPKPDPVFLPRAHGLWPGGKRYRVLQFISELLVRPGVYMHVDEILEKIRSIDGFENTTRSNLFGILSKLKHKGLVTSDHRGNWGLR